MIAIPRPSDFSPVGSLAPNGDVVSATHQLQKFPFDSVDVDALDGANAFPGLPFHGQVCGLNGQAIGRHIRICRALSLFRQKKPPHYALNKGNDRHNGIRKEVVNLGGQSSLAETGLSNRSCPAAPLIFLADCGIKQESRPASDGVNTYGRPVFAMREKMDFLSDSTCEFHRESQAMIRHLEVVDS